MAVATATMQASEIENHMTGSINERTKDLVSKEKQQIVVKSYRLA